MTEWYSAKELIDVDGLPKTVQGIIGKAKREDWQFRPRQGKGGGNEYHISSLPTATQDALRKTARQAAMETSPAMQAGAAAGRELKLAAKIEEEQTKEAVEASLAAVSTLDDYARTRMDARVQVLQSFARYAESFDGNKTAAAYAYAQAFNSDLIVMERWVKDHLRGGNISAASVLRWQKDLQKKGLCALAGRYGNRKGSSVLDTDPELNGFMEALIFEYPDAGASDYMRVMRACFGRNNVQVSLRALQRWTKDWKRKNERVLLAVSNPDDWKNKFMSAFGSASADILRLNQRWELDSTPADVHLTDGRYSIVAMIDVYSRRPLMHVAKTSSAAAVAAMLRRAIMQYGVPESVKIDNGQDYASKCIKRLCTGLNIEQHFSTPFSGWEKPHVERFFRTFSHEVCEMLPGYSGHNVADAQKLRARHSFADQLFKKNTVVDVKLSAAQLQAICDDWVNGIYMQRKHSGIGMSPLEKVAQWEGGIRTIDNERALDLLLADVPGDGTRSVTKKGIRITWEGEPAPHYYAGACLFEVPSREKVTVRFDPLGDMGKLYVFFRKAYLGIAECPELCGFDRNEFAAGLKKKGALRMSEERKVIKQKRKELKAYSVTEKMAEEAHAAAATVALMPAEAIPHTTTELSAAGDAIAADDAVPAVAPINQTTLAKAQQAMETEAMPKQSREERLARYLRVTADANASADDREWARIWSISIEGRAQLKLLELEGQS